MDDSIFFSKDFHQNVGMDFSLRGAQKMEAEGNLEIWVHAYLTCEPRWANRGLSDGLRKTQRIYSLLEIPVANLGRKCGPEPEMEYRQDRETFEIHVRAIENSLEDVGDLPPLVVEEVDGRPMVCDGTHRLEAIRRKGWATCWAILFSTP